MHWRDTQPVVGQGGTHGTLPYFFHSTLTFILCIQWNTCGKRQNFFNTLNPKQKHRLTHLLPFDERDIQALPVTIWWHWKADETSSASMWKARQAAQGSHQTSFGAWAHCITWDTSSERRKSRRSPLVSSGGPESPRRRPGGTWSRLEGGSARSGHIQRWCSWLKLNVFV